MAAAGEAPGDELRRNSDFAETLKRCAFPADMTTMINGKIWATGMDPNGNPTVGILDHDNVLWLGDFNYRLVLPDADVRKCIAQKRPDLLMSGDQLTLERRAGRVFQERSLSASLACAVLRHLLHAMFLFQWLI